MVVAVEQAEEAEEVVEQAEEGGGGGGGGGGDALLTVTLTPVLVVTFPAASRATAVSVCEPLLAVVLFQVTE